MSDTEVVQEAGHSPGVNPSTGIDKNALYGHYYQGEERRQRIRDVQNELYTKAAHMALDIQRDDEEMGDINVDKSTRIDKQEVHHHAAPVVREAARKLGWLAKAAIGAGLIATGAGIPAGIGLLLDFVRNRPAPVIQQGSDSDTATDIGFWDK